MYTGIFTYPLFVVLTTACFIAGFIDCVFLILLIFTYHGEFFRAYSNSACLTVIPQ